MKKTVMNENSVFDEIARILATPMPRRRMLGLAAGTMVGGTLASLRPSLAAAQAVPCFGACKNDAACAGTMRCFPIKTINFRGDICCTEKCSEKPGGIHSACCCENQVCCIRDPEVRSGCKTCVDVRFELGDQDCGCEKADGTKVKCDQAKKETCCSCPPKEGKKGAWTCTCVECDDQHCCCEPCPPGTHCVYEIDPKTKQSSCCCKR